MSHPDSTPARFTLDPAFAVGRSIPVCSARSSSTWAAASTPASTSRATPPPTRTGLRQDVLDLVRELGVTTVRYPGGNFVSGYRWEDGVGPRRGAAPPARPRLAHHRDQRVRPRRVHRLRARKAGSRADDGRQPRHPRRRRGPRPAGVLPTTPAGTALSDLRVAHGDKEPYGIRMWCLGNEMDGPWQTGHKTADEYGRLAAETARAMRQIDPGLELVACGSSSSGHADLRRVGGDGPGGDVRPRRLHLLPRLLRGERRRPSTPSWPPPSTWSHFIETVVATADHVGARLKSTKRINLSFDEWNVWYQ